MAELDRVGVLRSLLDEIAGECFASGELLPSQRVLAQRFGVSLAATREALEGLQDRRVIDLMPGDEAVVKDVEAWHFGDLEVMCAVLRARPGNAHLDLVRGLIPLVLGEHAGGLCDENPAERALLLDAMESALRWEELAS